MVLGSALHVFQYARCGRTPLACCWCRGALDKQTRAQDRSWCVYFKHFAKTRSSSKAPIRVALPGVETSHWISDLPLGTRNRGFLCVRVRREFPSLVKLRIFPQLSVKPRRLVTDICYRSSKHVVFSFQLGQVQNSSPGLTPLQLIPSELLGRVVGGLHWHVVGFEPPNTGESRAR